MDWIEEESNVKFICWNEPKDSLSEDSCLVVKKGESVEASIIEIDERRVEEDGEEKLDSIKFRLRVEGVNEDVLMWSNAAIKRQYLNLELKEGDKIRIKYVDDYETKYGKKGRNVRIAVGRDGKKKK